MSQQYQKFKITLARGMNKKHVSPISNPSKIKKNLSQKFGEEEEYDINQNEMIEKINELEAKIKETKRNLLHERELNIMLYDENENLRKTNQIIDKGILQNINDINTMTSQGGDGEDTKNKHTTSLPLNARLTNNIYENLMMGDLKNEFQRTQGEITSLSGNIGNIQNDITSMKNENKKLMSYIQNYKNIIRDIEERKAKRNKDKKKAKVEKINNLSNLVQSAAGTVLDMKIEISRDSKQYYNGCLLWHHSLD